MYRKINISHRVILSALQIRN